ncbi:MAG TPA: methylated-DNA--[protein]-cysteine S-methyltransferase [Thermotogaceae bacterium]|nr:methylated-DNA--[protein]-cysteine S-methyltransferase [Thermotogota bacterium]HEW91950.1 methylated-DNA--[protein]-cysteine S-methyltransferase [Thermotogaceae bacterium]
MKRYTTKIYTPAGDISIESDESGKKVFKIELGHQKSEKLICENREIEIVKQLCEYLKGKRKEFNIEFELKGTDFQIKVLKELMKVPYGTTITYKELAERVGNSNAARAVGNVVASNYLPIIIPCHRVVSKSGLGGFGGGIGWKKFLIDLERRNTK